MNVLFLEFLHIPFLCSFLQLKNDGSGILSAAPSDSGNLISFP